MKYEKYSQITKFNILFSEFPQFPELHSFMFLFHVCTYLRQSCRQYQGPNGHPHSKRQSKRELMKGWKSAGKVRFARILWRRKIHGTCDLLYWKWLGMYRYSMGRTKLTRKQCFLVNFSPTHTVSIHTQQFPI